MGMNNDKNIKQTPESLQNLVKSSKPLMPITSGKACIIENGKVILNMRHFKDEYKNINLKLEKCKNQMNVIILEESIELIQSKFDILKAQAKKEELVSSIEKFCPTYKNCLQNYYTYLTDIKKIYKESYFFISNYLSNWLKVQKKMETAEELGKIEQTTKNFDEMIKNFNIFNEIEELLQKICYFGKNFEGKDKYNDIKEYFEKNKDEINENFSFENLNQFRSLINLKEQIIDNIIQKKNFVEFLDSFLKEYLSLYKLVISQINSTNNEKVEIANELNEYNGVVIYHRLIRSIEERIKKVKL